MLAIRGEHPMEAREVESWARDQSGETGNEVERFENDVGRAVAERLLELVDDLPSLVGREALIGDRRAGGEQEPQGIGEGEHPLTDRLCRKDRIEKVSR